MSWQIVLSLFTIVSLYLSWKSYKSKRLEIIKLYTISVSNLLDDTKNLLDHTFSDFFSRIKLITFDNISIENTSVSEFIIYNNGTTGIDGANIKVTDQISIIVDRKSEILDYKLIKNSSDNTQASFKKSKREIKFSFDWLHSFSGVRIKLLCRGQNPEFKLKGKIKNIAPINKIIDFEKNKYSKKDDASFEPYFEQIFKPSINELIIKKSTFVKYIKESIEEIKIYLTRIISLVSSGFIIISILLLYSIGSYIFTQNPSEDNIIVFKEAQITIPSEIITELSKFTNEYIINVAAQAKYSDSINVDSWGELVDDSSFFLERRVLDIDDFKIDVNIRRRICGHAQKIADSLKNEGYNILFFYDNNQLGKIYYSPEYWSYNFQDSVISIDPKNGYIYKIKTFIVTDTRHKKIKNKSEIIKYLTWLYKWIPNSILIFFLLSFYYRKRISPFIKYNELLTTDEDKEITDELIDNKRISFFCSSTKYIKRKFFTR